MTLVQGPWLYLTVPTYTTVVSPLGELTLAKRAGDLVGLYLPEDRHRPERSMPGLTLDEGFDAAKEQLGEYFAGTRREFDVAHTALGTELQRRVWGLVSQIRYGQTATYGELARELGDGTTAREVGAAVGHNPLCIVIPCHRVVGAGGALTGYAGGLERKRFLLDLERSVAGHPGRLL